MHEILMADNQLCILLENVRYLHLILRWTERECTRCPQIHGDEKVVP